MATSRTGTAKYKKLTVRALHKAQVEGITHCQCTARCKTHTGRRCSVPLDYENRTRPNGASIDHIIPFAQGGEDTIENTQIRCLRCNTSTGDKQPRKRPTAVRSYTPTATGTRRAGRPPGS